MNLPPPVFLELSDKWFAGQSPGADALLKFEAWEGAG